MNLAIIIPTRGDRPLLMENCLRMMAAQTIKNFHIEVVDYPPTSDQVDITPRYRTGYDKLRGRGFDLIAFIEDDDWYAPDYLETMIREWEKNGKPDLFGTCYTIYYHIFYRHYYIMEHHQRASAMNTLIRPDLDFPWCVDIEPFLDLHLWGTIKNRIVFKPERHLAIGIKHGIGKTIAGGNHIISDRVKRRFHLPDNGLLEATMDAESFKFYTNIYQ